MLDQKFSKKLVKETLDFDLRRDQILELPSQLFSPYKLVILSALWREGELEFKQLLEDVPTISEGNLSSHLSTLEKLGIVDVIKEFEGKKPRTSYRLNNHGRKQVLEIALKLKKTFGDILED